MGFKCSVCKQHVEGEPETLVPVKFREVMYKNGSVYSKGEEIVQEDSVCVGCLDDAPEPITVPSDKIVDGGGGENGSDSPEQEDGEISHK